MKLSVIRDAFVIPRKRGSACDDHAGCQEEDDQVQRVALICPALA